MFDCALGPLTEGAVGDVEGATAEGLLVEGLLVDGDPAPGLLEPLELPELLCAIATPQESSNAASAVADMTFILTSMVTPLCINEFPMAPVPLLRGNPLVGTL